MMYTLRNWKYLEQCKELVWENQYEAYKEFLVYFKQLDKETQKVLYIRYYKHARVEKKDMRNIVNLKAEDIYRKDGITVSAVFKARKKLLALYVTESN